MSPTDSTIDIFSDETRRVAALHALSLLDSEPEREFDALVALAAEMLDCPTALLTLVDSKRLWIKAAAGGERGEISRDIGMCAYTIRSEDPLVIENLRDDTRFTKNPLVMPSNGARFYAGAPIHAIDSLGERQAIGSICVIDTVPRSLNDAGRRALVHLATLAETTIAARAAATQAIAIATTADRQTATLARQDRVFRQAERMAAIGSWRLSLDDKRVEWSDGVYRIYGLPIGDMPDMAVAMEFYPPHAREELSALLDRASETGEPFDVEVDFITVQGDPRRVRVLGERETLEGNPVGLVGVFQDVTERHALETTLRRSADTDSLTEIANRAAFDRALEAAMTRAHTHGAPLLLALVDLDGFKAINDTLGHTAGDDVLRGVGRVLQAPWLKGSFAARLGGDEFGLIIEDPGMIAVPDHIRARLEEALRFPIALNGLAMVSAGTVGMATLEPDCHSIRDFVHRADTTLYRAKRMRIGERRRSDRRNAA
ncbi:MAG: sensor domain-containing diguanylate cyclase [Pseudomonadota bacterium]|jgi:diguanylate cyclase (GGDEF)-like protein/PAS domain S-box-containing protein